MTMPSLISHYRHKVLETQFKKAYSVLSQAMIPVKSELISCPVTGSAEIKRLLFSQFNNLGVKDISDLPEYTFKTYNKKNTTAVIHANCLDPFSITFEAEVTAVSDSMVISVCTNKTYGNMISIDTNGSKKGPNAFGHDLFFFYLFFDNCNLEPMKAQWRSCTEDEEDCVSNGNFKWTTGSCSKDSDASENGFACTQYAIANTCPDNPGKGYFDCLP